jgi:hypothetical protein
LAFIPLSTSEFLQKNYSISTYSIYTLLGTIGELIRKVELNDLENGLLELSQWRTYPMVSFEKGLSYLNSEEKYDEIRTTKNIDGNSKLIEWFQKWYSEFTTIEKMYSPHLIGKISTRIFYTFNSIKNDKKSNLNLGIAMHRRIIALMNAILIEDVRENCDKSQGLNINNAVTSDTLFINNLRFANTKSNSDFSFSRWLLSCPLFLLYLDKEILKEDALVKFIFIDKENEMVQFEKNTIYDKLINVYTKETVILTNQNSTEKMSFSTEYKKIDQIARHLKVNGLNYKTFEEMKLSDFNKNYSKLFSNKINNDRLGTFKARIKEKGLQW